MVVFEVPGPLVSFQLVRRNAYVILALYEKFDFV